MVSGHRIKRWKAYIQVLEAEGFTTNCRERGKREYYLDCGRYQLKVGVYYDGKATVASNLQTRLEGDVYILPERALGMMTGTLRGFISSGWSWPRSVRSAIGLRRVIQEERSRLLGHILMNA